MALKYDAEFAEAFKAFAALSGGGPPPVAPVYDVETRRAMMRMANAGPPAPDIAGVRATVHEVEVTGGAKIEVHAFEATEAVSEHPVAAVIHAHGGGMIMGSVGVFRQPIMDHVAASGVSIFSVDYRLAPENNGIGLVEDVYAALLWLHKNAKQFNVDPARIGVMGESAGAGIVAGVALMARDKGLSPPLAKQILVYPMLDDRNNKPVKALEGLTPLWSLEDNLTGWAALLGRDKAGNPDADVSYYAAPARASSLAGLPSTYIDVGGLDFFRNEDIAYAARIAAENIEIEFHLYPGVPHGFELFAPKISTTTKALSNRVKALSSF